MLTRPLAGYLAPTAIGKAVMDTAPKVAQYVTQLPISKAIGQTIDQTQAMFANVQNWINSSYQNVREHGRQAETFVQKELNKMEQQSRLQSNSPKTSRPMHNQRRRWMPQRRYSLTLKPRSSQRQPIQGEAKVQPTLETNPFACSCNGLIG